MNLNLVQLPVDLVGWVTLIAANLVGAVMLLNLFDKGRRERNKENNLVDDRVISLLKEQISQLEKKSVEQGKNLETMQTELTKLGAENKLLKDLVQGRDPQTVDFQERGLVAIARVEEITAIAHENQKAILKVQQNIERLYKLIEKQLKIMIPNEE